jgi:hypothetical protein
MNMQNNMSTAALAYKAVHRSAFLALVAAQTQRRSFPFAIFNRSAQLEILSGFATLPVAI